MDVPLDQLAVVSEAVGRAEEAAEAQAWQNARDAIDEVDSALDGLRGRYRELDERARTTVARIAGPLRARRDAVAGMVPAPRALSDAAPEHDPEQDEDPDEVS